VASYMTKVIVKVGNTSNLIFRNTKAYRAITTKELNRLVELHPDLSIAIIENIKEHEYEDVKSFINNKGKHINIYFYVPDNNDITCGLADEIIYPIFLNKESLFNAIKNDTGLNLSNDVTKNIISGKQNSDISTFDDAFDQSFNTTIESFDEYKSKIETEDIELPTIYNKDDIESFNITDNDILEITDEIDEDTIKDEVDEVKIDDTSGDILLVKYHDIEKERNSLKNQLKSAMGRIQHLTELNEALTDEYNTIKSMLESYSKIEEVIEEPITLGEYNELKGKLDKITKENKELKDKLDDINNKTNSLNADNKDKKILESKLGELEKECEKHKNNITKLEGIIELKDKNIDDISTECTNLKLEIETIRSTIDEDKLAEAQNEITELNSNISELEDRIAEYDNNLHLAKEELSQVKQSLEKSIDDLERSNNEISVKIDEITNLKEEKQSYIDQIQELTTKVNDLTDRLGNYNSLEEQVIELQELKEKYEDQVELDRQKIEELTTMVEDTDKRIELARQYSRDELNKKQRENIELQSKLDLISAKLSAKEVQYDELIKTAGVDSSGASTVLESSKMIEEVNRTLRNQIVSLKKEIDRSTKDAEFANQNARALGDQNRQLKTTIKAMSSGLSGSGVVGSLPPCNYTGKGMIIPVFGCGSFGITTTAMSIATKLATQSRVLYVDFDMVNPKADAWFKLNPIVKNIPDYDRNNTRATGLGLFVEKQMQYFLSHSNSLISRAINTKGGSIDYLSGFYAKPDTIKLISADFTSLLNYFGNNYTYIIIDFGKLGCSDINDQIIKMVSDIAYRNVVVTTSDKLEVRTFRIKINDAKIDINNIAWLLNMCTSTSLETTAKRAISPAEYSMIPLNMDMYGKKIDFLREKLTRDKFQLFMDKTLFRK